MKSEISHQIQIVCCAVYDGNFMHKKLDGGETRPPFDSLHCKYQIRQFFLMAMRYASTITITTTMSGAAKTKTASTAATTNGDARK